MTEKGAEMATNALPLRELGEDSRRSSPRNCRFRPIRLPAEKPRFGKQGTSGKLTLAIEATERRLIAIHTALKYPVPSQTAGTRTLNPLIDLPKSSSIWLRLPNKMAFPKSSNTSKTEMVTVKTKRVVSQALPHMCAQ